MSKTVHVTTKPTFPGLFRMSAAKYHADPCEAPSLSSGILCTLIESSPLHAHHFHPRLGAAKRADVTKAMEFGSAAHKLALDMGADICIVGAENYRTKAAQEARAGAEAAGLIPILEAEYEDAERLANRMTATAEQFLGLPMADCLREVVVVWEEGGMWRRIMVDAMRPDLSRACDLKTTQGSAAPEQAVKRIYDMNYHIQRAHYVMGLDAIDPEQAGRREFAFIFGEADEPHGVSPPLLLSPAGIDVAERLRALGTTEWDQCLRSGVWPGYGETALLAEPPVWVLQRHEMGVAA